ncbi:MAG: DNA-directed RNA polymerase subunit alpha [SAR324 cluster bacterium]|uniref:DNA-directed RNA polymerase subunit alpha n=1 Tax=SAR324 cluster bacterium TaxID=2024889 RepID=A0A432GJY9_9DELT|nr:MAG: DNA-directed RNA polymerase subunit alpha [SAR324 cluster bacterium]RTZ88403.1 MAG: DNA-directed RNA polymerase subunit alpha [SAR324 cluster bacterium]
MTELNETIEEADPEAENVSPEDNAITGTESDSNSEEESTDENPFFAKNWMSIAKPKKLQFESENLKSDYAKFSLDPLEPGFGTTIGHSLRRVLLSSIRGSAVFAVQIDGVTHEFSNIPGIVEDMVQVILNIKELQVEQFVDEVVELELIGEGPCVIKAGDISTFEKAEILNPDLVLATLQKGATVSMTMYSRFNKGYVTSEENQQEDLPVGTIYLDSNHSPVSRINYDVVNSRVDQKTDYDRLNFELWTNGSVKPTDCLAYAAKIIKEHMDVFINFDESSIKDEPEEEIEEEPLNENLYRSVSELELSVRSINCLQNAKIETIGDLVQKSEQAMLKTKNFGRKSLNEIKVILTEMGLSLGTEVENFDPMNNPHTN